MTGRVIVMAAWLLAAGDTDDRHPAAMDEESEVVPGECVEAVQPPTPDPTYRSNTPGAEVVATHTPDAEGLATIADGSPRSATRATR